MEYFLVRAMEIGRLMPDQIDKLHNHEVRIERCFMPYEIQDALGLPPLKEHYRIPPEDLNAQVVHSQRLRGDFRRADLYPVHGDVLQTRIENVHEFDQKVLEALENNMINLFYMGPSKRRKKRTDEVEDSI